MSVRKSVPVTTGASHNLCPVCGKRSYSAAGTHPQCAQRQAEAVRKEKMAAEKKAEEMTPPDSPMANEVSWAKEWMNYKMRIESLEGWSD